MDYAALARDVERERLARGWSKEHAARQAGISSITWKRVEDGLAVQEAKLAAILLTLGLRDADEAEIATSAGVAAPDYVLSPGAALPATATNADIVDAMREMAEAIREMKDANLRVLEHLERGSAAEGN